MSSEAISWINNNLLISRWTIIVNFMFVNERTSWLINGGELRWHREQSKDPSFSGFERKIINFKEMANWTEGYLMKKSFIVKYRKSFPMDDIIQILSRLLCLCKVQNLWFETVENLCTCSSLVTMPGPRAKLGQPDTLSGIWYSQARH